jgi:hypothetical protein
MSILHPDTNQPIKIAYSLFGVNLIGKLAEIEGDDSDGYKAIVINDKDKIIGLAIDYVDSDGWHIQKAEVKPPGW